ncbi:MAG: hypothetical protein ACK4S4_15665 [Pyrinomonadaceae bacterium]
MNRQQRSRLNELREKYAPPSRSDTEYQVFGTGSQGEVIFAGVYHARRMSVRMARRIANKWRRWRQTLIADPRYDVFAVERVRFLWMYPSGGDPKQGKCFRV